ncbi:hypothetical protein Bca4012_069107 [Brassica carinata]|uniref:Uncharacterized protein n=1 Tax=Brassica carinata TaxID=52824 RepID=A0A8X7P7W4_BRACI|nr:hypothetical protein Bca52824_085470 [Brassica carinata]
MLNHDRDEELSLFLEMRRREKEHRGESLLTGSDDISINGALTTAVSEALSGISETMSSQRYPLRRTAAENFLYSENEKSDYDWLLTPPGTPQFEKESHRSVMNELDAPNSRPTFLKSRLGNCGEEMISGNNNNPQVSSSSGPSSVAGLRRPSSSCSSRSTSRPSTPTRRSTPTTTSTTRTVTTTRASASRSSTPTSRATLTAARATTSTSAPRTTTSTGSRSATPTRSKTQPSSSAPSKKSLSRAATPTRRPSTPTGPSVVSSKAPSRGTSPAPTLKSSRPRKPPEMPGFSLEAPPNLRTTLPNRPVSDTRGRPGVASAPGSRSSSIERGSGGVVHARRQSCSPSRRQAPIGNTNGSLPGARGRGGKANNGGSSYDSFSPVAMGNKMVERVVNMRKLGPPRLTENGGGRGTVKSNSAFNSLGYGRNLSKSSIDMALRHMDIRRGMTGNLRPLVTKVPASSMYSVRSRSTSVTNSPVATSSTMSSSEESLDNMNILCLDGNDAENDDLLSERSYS